MLGGPAGRGEPTKQRSAARQRVAQGRRRKRPPARPSRRKAGRRAGLTGRTGTRTALRQAVGARRSGRVRAKPPVHVGSGDPEASRGGRRATSQLPGEPGDNGFAVPSLDDLMFLGVAGWRARSATRPPGTAGRSQALRADARAVISQSAADVGMADEARRWRRWPERGKPRATKARSVANRADRLDRRRCSQNSEPVPTDLSGPIGTSGGRPSKSTVGIRVAGSRAGFPTEV